MYIARFVACDPSFSGYRLAIKKYLSAVSYLWTGGGTDSLARLANATAAITSANLYFKRNRRAYAYDNRGKRHIPLPPQTVDTFTGPNVIVTFAFYSKLSRSPH